MICRNFSPFSGTLLLPGSAMLVSGTHPTNPVAVKW